MVDVIKNRHGMSQITTYSVVKDYMTQKRKTVFDVPRNIFLSGTGGGKSVAIEAQSEMYYGKAKIIRLTDLKNNIENGCCAFSPENPLHLRELEFLQNRTPRAYPVQILAPFSYRVREKDGLDKRMPPIELFTVSIKSLTRRNFSVLFSMYNDSGITENCIVLKNRLGRGDGFPQFYTKFNEVVLGGEKKGKMLDSMSSDAHLSIDKKSLRDINTYAKTLNDVDRFIVAQENPHNLDMLRVLNDKERITIFTYRYLSDEKSRDLCIDIIMDQIVMALESGKVKTDVVLCIDEITAIFSKENKGHKVPFGNNMAERLTKIRSIAGKYLCGFIVAGNSLTNTSQTLINNGFALFLGHNSSIYDRSLILKHSRRDLSRAIEKIPIGSFHYTKDSVVTEYKVLMPRHAHAERGFEFIQKWREVYSDRCITLRGQYESISALIKGEDERNEEYIERYNEGVRREAEEKKRVREEKSQEKKPKIDAKDEVLVHNLIKELYSEGMGVDRIGKELKKKGVAKWHFNKIKEFLVAEGVWDESRKMVSKFH